MRERIFSISVSDLTLSTCYASTRPCTWVLKLSQSLKDVRSRIVTFLYIDYSITENHVQIRCFHLHSLYNLVEKAGTHTTLPTQNLHEHTAGNKAHIWAGAGLRFIDTSCLEPLSYLQLHCADCIDQLCKRYYILIANQQGLLFSDSYQFHRELCQSVPETFPPGVAPVRIVFPVECVEPLANLMAQQHAWTLDRSSSPCAQRRD